MRPFVRLSIRLGGMMAVLALLVSLLALAGGNAASELCQPRIVAVFDIGSGTTRMQVADIALCRQTGPHTLLRREAAIGFASDLARQDDGGFSAEIMQRASAEIAEMIETARAAGAEQLIGVATAAFRRSANAEQLVEAWQQRFGLAIDIIDQRDEGRLAYRMIEAGRVDSAPLLVWDIGAGSQQLVWRHAGDGRFEDFNPGLASVTFRNLAMVVLDRPDNAGSPNPIMPEEADRLAALVRERMDGSVPAGLIELIDGGATVVGVGGVHGASLVGQAGLRAGDQLTRELLAQVLADRLGLDDAAIGGDYADTQVTNLILVLTLMDIFAIEAYRATRADLTDALLVRVADRLGRIAPVDSSP